MDRNHFLHLHQLKMKADGLMIDFLIMSHHVSVYVEKNFIIFYPSIGTVIYIYIYIINYISAVQNIHITVHVDV